MKLYHSPKAPNPDRVTYFLRAKGKLDAVDLEEVSIMEQAHKTPEYRELSPFAQVPVLVLDDTGGLSARVTRLPSELAGWVSFVKWGRG